MCRELNADWGVNRANQLIDLGFPGNRWFSGSINGGELNLPRFTIYASPE
jgi:hypothetical protein